ncbi:hypothetical protein RHGRI_024504 [Rhododendron griersonianum]|uniref:Uncharacterized protein n=1 Tax=Rhododendron griersonianum TaxID=479676 RepID=A0AAV6J9K5_9ERIC|nr:hypothetical protein RHGRI_024504 [Rhododendron griersonianum]
MTPLILKESNQSNGSDPGPLDPFDDMAHLPHGIIFYFPFSSTNLSTTQNRFRKGKKKKQSTPGLCFGNPCVHLSTPISALIAPLDSYLRELPDPWVRKTFFFFFDFKPVGLNVKPSDPLAPPEL